MKPRPILLLLMSAAAVCATVALAQDKGSVDTRPLPPLANPNDPKLGAKELFAQFGIVGIGQRRQWPCIDAAFVLRQCDGGTDGGGGHQEEENRAGLHWVTLAQAWHGISGGHNER